MKWFEKIINVIYVTIIVLAISFIGWGVFDTGKNVYNDFNNQEEQMQELYNNQAYLLSRIYELSSRPDYDNLALSTVYIVNGKSAGTGVIVKYDRGYDYILTNKHVCSEDARYTCTVLTEKGFVNIEFIKQSESKDMSLWKTNKLPLDYKPVKGFREVFPGDKVFSVGHYLGMPYMYTEGVMSGYGEDHTIYNMPCVFGCSGSGIFDNQGYLTGLVSQVPGFRIPTYMTVQVDTTKAKSLTYDQIMLFLDEILP